MNKDSVIYKIKEYLPKEQLYFTKNPKTQKLQCLIMHKNITIIIFEDKSWDKIKEDIDSKIEDIGIYECFSCLNISIKNRTILCTNCGHNRCIDCHMKIFRKNSGIVYCSACLNKQDELPLDCLMDVMYC